MHAVDWHPQHSSIFATGRAAKNPYGGDVKIWDLKEKTGSGDLSPIGRLFTADGVRSPSRCKAGSAGGQRILCGGSAWPDMRSRQVSNIMWRPGYKYQLATTYMSRITRIDLWDIPCYWTPLAGMRFAFPATDTPRSLRR